MKKTLKVSLILVISAILAAVFAISFYACAQENIKNDVEITFVDMNGAAITNSQITIGGITDMDIAEQRTTDGDGKIVIQNLEARELTFNIFNEENSFTEIYSLTNEEVEHGNIQVQFINYSFE